MKWLVILNVLLYTVNALPQVNPFQRRGSRQLDFDQAEIRTSYGAPEQQDNLAEVESRQQPQYNNAYEPETSASELRENVFEENGSLENTIPGIPGQDYPTFREAPPTQFSCEGRSYGGYYADPESDCQSFHICGPGAEGRMNTYTFLCPNGTIFNQEYFLCDWWFNVDCQNSASLAVERNNELFGAREAATRRLEEERRQNSRFSNAAASNIVETVVPAREASSSYIAEEAQAPAIQAPASYGVEVVSESRQAPSSYLVNGN